MRRIFLAITALFLTAALMTQGMYAYRATSTQVLIAEEEPHEEKPHIKQKTDFKECFEAGYNLFNPSLSAKNNYLRNHSGSYPKGFVEKPFTPPDLL